MQHFYYTFKFSIGFALIAPMFSNTILYLLGESAFGAEPLLIVTVFAAIVGALMGRAFTEDNLAN